MNGKRRNPRDSNRLTKRTTAGNFHACGCANPKCTNNNQANGQQKQSTACTGNTNPGTGDNAQCGNMCHHHQHNNKRLKKQ